jgi:pyruvate formate lyase activating enzyme
MQIAGYLKTSVIEWPGKITSVIFTPGCNFRCPFCHNRDLVVRDKDIKISRDEENEVLKDLRLRKKWIDAVVITGGEPTLQKDLPDFLKKIKRRGILTMIHTNGTRPEVISRLVISRLVDYFCLDLKGDFENYEKYTNVQLPITNVQKSLKEIVKSGAEYEFRTTVVPGLHELSNLRKLAKEIKGITSEAKWCLQQFRPMNTLDQKFMKVKPYSKEEMEGFQKKLQKIIPGIFLRGI